MSQNAIKIPANQDEVTMYCYLGEALCKTQIVEQALSCSITIKINPNETKEQVDEFLKRQQRLTLGTAVKTARENNLYDCSLQKELDNFLKQRNWLVHQAMADFLHNLKTKEEKEGFFGKIKSISDKAEDLQRKIEYDMIHFSTSKGKDMSKILALLKMQEQGVRVQM